jgi:4-hydroxybenzoate polyprenyltransferase
LVKNLLIFVPLIASARMGHPDLLFRICIALASLSLLASGLYIVNDVVDLESDRRDVHKRSRPFASGRLSLKYAILAAPALIVAAFALADLLPPAAMVVVAIYLAASLLYSFGRKRNLFAGVCISAALYMLRIVMGGASSGVALPAWFIACSLMLSVGLALFERITSAI